jgi:hypothetical protein
MLCLYFQQQDSNSPAIKKARQQYNVSSTHHHSYLSFSHTLFLLRIYNKKIIQTPFPEMLITKTSETQRKIDKTF